MTHAVLDLAGAPPGVALPPPVPGWRSADVRPGDCVLRLDDAQRSEVLDLAAQLRARPLPVTLCTPQEFHMPRLRAFMARVHDALAHGVGVCVVDRLPLAELTHDESLAIYWCLGQLLGRTVAQKFDGTMLYDVTDTGQAYGYGVRGSYTNVELVFHTDNAFGCAPPDRVGLLCLRPAREGGVSRFCSVVAVHEALRAGAPNLLERLYRPMLWDRQAEHAPHAARVSRAAMFERAGAGWSARVNPSLVRKGYEIADEPMDTQLEEALAAFQALTEDPRFWFELAIERGQLQYLDNVRVAHYRSEFRDHEDPGLKRHLVRTWHRERGRRSYDG